MNLYTATKQIETRNKKALEQMNAEKQSSLTISEHTDKVLDYMHWSERKHLIELWTDRCEECFDFDIKKSELHEEWMKFAKTHIYFSILVIAHRNYDIAMEEIEQMWLDDIYDIYGMEDDE